MSADRIAGRFAALMASVTPESNPAADDRDALAKALHEGREEALLALYPGSHADSWDSQSPSTRSCYLVQADAILASEWLAAHDRKVAAEALRKWADSWGWDGHFDTDVAANSARDTADRIEAGA